MRRRWTDSLLLLGAANRRLDLGVTLVLTAAVACSRLCLLASGPWEWDETLFAHGLVMFKLAAHYPHPPGFPGWLALGHLLLPLTGDPLRALQLASAGLSVLALWPLAALGRKVAPGPVALLAAVAVLLLPGPWLHAVRGFSSTPATVLALYAALLAVNGLEGRRLTAFSLLVTCAFLIRPILLPSLGVLWLAGALSVRSVRRLLPGVGISAALVGGAAGIMAHAEGGWGPFIKAFATHGSRHLADLSENVGGWRELGLVKGVGGSWWALVLLLLAAVGLVVWSRRLGKASAAIWLVVLGVTCAQLLLIQNRTYSRYAVPVQLALAPLIAGAASLVPPAAACTGLVALLVVQSWQASPLLWEQHQRLMPGWQAVTTGFDQADKRDMAVVVEPGLYPFASYLWHVRGNGVLAADPQLVLGPVAPEPFVVPNLPWLVATDQPQRYLPPLVAGQRRWEGVSRQLALLTQGRFLTAELLCNPPLPISGWWSVEHSPTGGSFQWGGSSAVLLVPPLPPGTWVELDLRPAPGPAPLVIEIGGRTVMQVDGFAVRSRYWLAPDELSTSSAQELHFRRATGYRPDGQDGRELGVQLFGVRAVGPALGYEGSLASVEDRLRIRVRLSGAYDRELFGTNGDGCWVAPRARLEAPAQEGRLTLTLSAPRPTAPATVITIAGTRRMGPLTFHGRRTVALDVTTEDPQQGVVVLELVSVPFIPAMGSGSRDQRELGIVLHTIRFEPADSSSQRWSWGPDG